MADDIQTFSRVQLLDGTYAEPRDNTKAVIDDTAGDGDTNKAWSADRITEAIDNIVAVRDTQPTAPETQIWFPATPATGTQVPTYAEFTALEILDKLRAEDIPDTVQSITFDNVTGNVSQVTHTANNVAVRTDVFTFGTGTITEVRTLSTGQSLTIVTNTTTLATTITYAAAAA